jgi:hypothetical protein
MGGGNGASAKPALVCLQEEVAVTWKWQTCKAGDVSLIQYPSSHEMGIVDQ